MNEPTHVRYANLTRAFPDSNASLCPLCHANGRDGLLLLERDRTTLLLVNRDSCTLCGTLFVYDDFATIQALYGETGQSPTSGGPS
jgi:hypothetical protein